MSLSWVNRNRVTRAGPRDSGKFVIVGLEKVKRNHKMGRAYAQSIKGYGADDFKAFFEGDIDVKAHVITDGWTGYSPLKDTYKGLEQRQFGGGKNFRSYILTL